MRSDVVNIDGRLNPTKLTTLDALQITTQTGRAQTPHRMAPTRNVVPPPHGMPYSFAARSCCWARHWM